MLGANRAPILREDYNYLSKGRNELALEPRHPGVPSVHAKRFLGLWYIWCKPRTNLAPTLTPSPNKPKPDST